VTDSMKKLEAGLVKENILDKFTMEVDLCSCSYFITKEKMSKFPGHDVSWIGPTDPNLSKIFDEKFLVLFIQIKCNTSIEKDKIISLTSPLKLTPNADGNKVYDVYSIRDSHSYTQEKVKTFYYRREGFLEAYNGMKKMIPDLTENEFASFGVEEVKDYYDSYQGKNCFSKSLVDKSEIERENEVPLDVEEFTKQIRSEQPDFSMVRINIYSIDIDREDNFSKLVELLKYCAEYAL